MPATKQNGAKAGGAKAPAPRDRSIGNYRARRDFARTPEPGPMPRAKSGKALIFVVQKHDATRLHYDFRLEHGGVLWSWAVPKGPSMDPKDKRLAVHVEDHPVEYAEFQGEIPEGNYGAGTVETWDRGTWAPVSASPAADLENGELKFTLQGERLHGHFVLVRLKQKPKERAENWLLIKEHDDAEQPGADVAALETTKLKPAKRRAAAQKSWAPPADAKRARLPQSQAPMLASNADAPPQGDEWLSEIKFDGYRLLAFKDADTVRLLTRNGLDWTHRLPSVTKAVALLPAETLLLDGELVALQQDGLSSFAALQAALSEGHDGTLSFYLFDLLYRDGYDLRALPLTARKQALETLLLPSSGHSLLKFSEHLEAATPEVRTRACAMGLEGIICKRASSPYKAGRGSAWLKLKCQGRDEFLIIGWTNPQGGRSGLGSIHLGFYDDKGALHYAGGCGSGFSDKVLKSLSEALADRRTDPPADLRLTEEKPPAGLHWVRPTLVCEVQYTGWSGAGRLRHAVFLGLREDKAPTDIVRDIPDPEVRRVTLSQLSASHSGRFVTARKPSARAAEIEGIRLTHPDRELWPGITKQALADYFTRIADVALPGIASRPLALVRCPEGIAGEHFFQKHLTRGMPAALQEGAFDGAPYLALHDTAGLIACAQIAALEIHTWGSTEQDPGRPDRLIFDLDPGEGVAWSAIVAAAHDISKRLEKAGLASFCRTSGGNGLHVVVPLIPAAGWDAARAWCRAFAERAERDAPDTYVASTPKARRRGRILIDWLRNGLGSTAIASFSPRARENATVAMPLAWKEVTARLDAQKFTITTAPSRMDRDVWPDFVSAGAKLPHG
jgi:bifunctional non-homologous end joining protein LigD